MLSSGGDESALSLDRSPTVLLAFVEEADPKSPDMMARTARGHNWRWEKGSRDEAESDSSAADRVADARGFTNIADAHSSQAASTNIARTDAFTHIHAPKVQAVQPRPPAKPFPR
jgi:hypothetical protein